MKDAKFTEGPWEIHGNGQIVSANGNTVCMMIDDAELTFGNAYLVRTAPDLYGELHKLRDAISSAPADSFGCVEDTHDTQGYYIRDEIIHNISSVLRKARGE